MKHLATGIACTLLLTMGSVRACLADTYGIKIDPEQQTSLQLQDPAHQHTPSATRDDDRMQAPQQADKATQLAGKETPTGKRADKQPDNQRQRYWWPF